MIDVEEARSVIRYLKGLKITTIEGPQLWTSLRASLLKPRLGDSPCLASLGTLSWDPGLGPLGDGPCLQHSSRNRSKDTRFENNTWETALARSHLGTNF